jgi:hypothetical protein
MIASKQSQLIVSLHYSLPYLLTAPSHRGYAQTVRISILSNGGRLQQHRRGHKQLYNRNKLEDLAKVLSRDRREVLTMAHTMLFGERRLHDRLYCAFSIHIEDNERSYSASLRNLSLGGALVEPPTHFSPKVGQELRLTIPFRKRPGVVVVKGKIAYTRRDGLAIVFEKRHYRPSDGWLD